MQTRVTITLDARAQRRLYVLNLVLGGGLTLAEAATYLELSERQVRRLLAGLTGEQGAALLLSSTRYSAISPSTTKTPIDAHPPTGIAQ